MNKEQLKNWCLEKSALISNSKDPLYILLAKAAIGIGFISDDKALEYIFNLHELHLQLAKIEGSKAMIRGDELARLRGCKSGTVRNACIRGDIPGAINPSGRLWLVPADTDWQPKQPGGQRKQEK